MAAEVSNWSKLWDQTDAVTAHTLKGIEFFEKYAAFVKERAIIEEEYAAKLHALVKKNASVVTSKKKDDDLTTFSTAKSFFGIVSEVESLAHQHESIAEQLKKDIYANAMGKCNQLRVTRKKQMADLHSMNVNLSKVVEGMEKAARSYSKAFKDAEAAHIKHSKNEKNMDLSRAELEKSKQNVIAKVTHCETAKVAYGAALQSANDAKDRHFAIALPGLLSAMRSADIDRIHAMQDAMKKSVEAETSVMHVIQKCYDDMMAAIKNINPDADAQVVVEQNTSGYPIPPAYQFNDLGDPAEVLKDGPEQTMKRGSLSGLKNGKSTSSVIRKQSMHQKFFGTGGGSNEKTRSNGSLHGEYGNLPPQQRIRKLQQKIDELMKDREKVQNSLSGVEKMADVYRNNPKMGDLKTVVPQLEEYQAQLTKVDDEIDRYKDLVEQIEMDMRGSSALAGGGSLPDPGSARYNGGHPSPASSSSPRISSSGVSSAANTNRTSYSEESVSSEGSTANHHGFNGVGLRRTGIPIPADAIQNAITPKSTVAAPLAVSESSSIFNAQSSLGSLSLQSSNGTVRAADDEPSVLPTLGTCKALYSFDGASDGTTVSMREGDEMLLLERDEGDGWTRIRHLRTLVEGFVPTTYLHCAWYPPS